jgi:uncharacterized protein (DUF58 family)
MVQLSQDLLRKLDRVSLVDPGQTSARNAGARRSAHHGSSPEFADFRSYTEGDDLRRVDWNAFARLDQLFLRLHAGEDTGTVTILLDRSRSMQFGNPTKARVAASIAGALAYVALHGSDRVSVAGWSGGIDRVLPPQSGMRSLSRTWGFIDDVMDSPAGHTDFGALKSIGAASGPVVVISDFLTDTDIRSGLLGLGLNHHVSVIQILTESELEPDFRGDWQLVDVESQRSVEVTVAPRAIKRYQDNLRTFTDDLQVLCRRYGMSYLLLSTGIPLEENLVRKLLQAGIVG